MLMSDMNYKFLNDIEILTSLLNVLPDAAVILNEKQDIITHNEKSIQLFKSKSKIDISEEIRRIIENEKLHLPKVFEEKEPISFTGKFMEKFLNISVYPFNLENPEFPQFVMFFDDLTIQKLSEEGEKRKTYQLQRLLEIAQHLNSTLDPLEVLSRIGRESCDLLKCYCAIYQLEMDGKTLKPMVVVDPVYEEEIMSSNLDIDHSLTGKSVKQREALLFNDVVGDDEAYQVPGTSELPNERLIVVPFIMDEEVLGAMCLNRIGNAFSVDEFSLAQTFAAFATTAFRNAKHYFELQHEIAERINTEKSLDANREHLKLINKILRHDIRNHLAVVKSSLKLYRANKESEEYLDNADIRLQESLSLITRMRDLEEFITSNHKLRIYNIEKEILKISKQYNNIRLNISGKSRILADEALSSVINNLFNNAIIHGHATEINVTILREERFSMVRFSDNGKGIPDDIKPYIFDEKYSYGDSAQSGLGLYIVKNIIERYGGYVYVEDNIPKGTSFNFTFKKVQ